MKGFSRVASYSLEHPSSIREIMNIVTDYREHPEKYPRKLIYLGGGWPQDPPPPPISEALEEVARDPEAFKLSSRYGATRGQPYFIRSVAEYEERVFGRKVDPDEVIVGLGSTELTLAFIKALVDPGDEVILTSPAYLNYERQILIETMLRARVKRWRLIRWGGFNPSLESLKKIASRRTKLLILTSPGNPDSQVMPNDVLEGALDLAEDLGFWVMVDVAYRGFIYGETPRYMLRERREREIIMASFSKELRVPGWRAAYAVADRELLRAVETIEQATNLCPSRLVQETLYRVFSDGERLRMVKEYIERGRTMYARVARYAYRLLKRYSPPGVRSLRPQGGFYLFFDHSKYVRESKRFCDGLLREWQVALAPGRDFGMEGWTRLSFAPLVLDKETLREGLERIGRFFESLRRRAA